MEPRLSLITLGVRDLARATAFYEALGFPRRLPEAERVAFFQLNGLGLSLFPLEDLAADSGQKPTSLSAFRGMAIAHNVRSPSDVDKIISRWEGLGGQLVRGPSERAWGGYTGYVADLDGHLWEIAWNPAFPLDEAGNLSVPERLG
jgi:catechol 2,3-dioxygenase-like lactoylglutathione lyase family enzyme